MTGNTEHNALHKSYSFINDPLHFGLYPLQRIFDHYRTEEPFARMQPLKFCSSTWLIISVAISVADPISKLNFLRFLNASITKCFTPEETLVISVPGFIVEDTTDIKKKSLKSRLSGWNVMNTASANWGRLAVSRSNNGSHNRTIVLGKSIYREQDVQDINSNNYNSCSITKQSNGLRTFNMRSETTWKFINNNPYYKYISQGINYRINNTSEGVRHVHRKKYLFNYVDSSIINQFEDNWNFNNHIIRMLHEQLKWSFAISSVGSSGYQSTKYKDSNYIITTCACNVPKQVLEHTERQLQTLQARSSWNPRGKFIVLVTQNYGAFSKVLAKRMLQLLWNFKVLNVIVAIPDCESALAVYTWFPYQSPELCTHVTEVVLNYWIFEGNGQFLLNTSLYPQKIPQDLQGCKVSVSTLEIEPFVILSQNNSGVSSVGGIEGRLFRGAMKKLNLRYKLKLPGNENWGEKLPNNTWTGMKGDLFNNVTELGFGGLLLDRELCELFECTRAYLKDRLVWHVPRAKQVAQWKGFYRVFDKGTWAVIIIVTITVALLLWHMGRTAKGTSYSALAKRLSHVWASSLGIAVPEQTHALRPRLLLMFWMIYCLHMNAVYLSFLTSFLINPGFERQVRSVDELVKSNLDYGYHAGFDKYFNDSSDEILMKILSRRKHCEGDGEGCLRRMADRGDFAMLVSSMLVQYKTALKFMDHNGNTLFNHFEDSFLDYDLVMYMSKGSHLLERIDSVIHRIVESGMLERWWEEMKNSLRRKRALLTVEESSSLSFSHLKSIFVFLLFGLATSLTVFIGEFSYFILRTSK
jgi:hypothetical protein